VREAALGFALEAVAIGGADHARFEAWPALKEKQVRNGTQ
jgi:hypothetical protein